MVYRLITWYWIKPKANHSELENMRKQYTTSKHQQRRVPWKP